MCNHGAYSVKTDYTKELAVWIPLAAGQVWICVLQSVRIHSKFDRKNYVSAEKKKNSLAARVNKCCGL